MKIADLEPVAAVLLGWKELDTALTELYRAEAEEPDKYKGTPLRMIRALEKQELIEPQVAHVVHPTAMRHVVVEQLHARIFAGRQGTRKHTVAIVDAAVSAEPAAPRPRPRPPAVGGLACLAIASVLYARDLRGAVLRQGPVVLGWRCGPGLHHPSHWHLLRAGCCQRSKRAVAQSSCN